MPKNAWLFPFFLLTKLVLTLPLSAALPELSSIEPLEFDENAQRLVARGDARLDFDGTRIRADRITYYQEYSMADATGNVVVSRDGYRLLADRMSFDAEENVFAVDLFRTGEWPFYVSGVTGGGTMEESTLEGATVYLGNPGRFTPNVGANQLIYVNDQVSPFVQVHGATLRIGQVPFFYIPRYTHYLDNPPYHLDINAGRDSKLGVYLQTTTLAPIGNWVRAGANFDVYSKRGVLAGPAAQYVYDSATQRVVGALSTGYIKDQGDPELDVFEEPIGSNRGYAEWRHKHHIGDRVSLTAAAHYWSDSEVTRDFREDYYSNNQRPDTFAEGVYAGDNYFISVFGRFRPNDFQLIQERLPEIRYDLLPVPIFETGAYHRLSASYARLRERFGEIDPLPLLPNESESNRFDLTYRIERPFLISDWLTWTPLAGARLTHYENQNVDPAFVNPELNSQFTREIYEVGFDLEARAYASYPTVNRTWGIDGLRHLVRPVLRYRYFSDPDALNEIAAIDRQVFEMNRPVLDLSDLRHVDSIQETHLARLGVENLFQTRAQGYGSRTLAALNFYQDILFEKGTRYDGDKEETFHATWVELMLNPAPWLKFDLASRFKTESLMLEELRSRVAIKSGEIWEIGLSTDYLNSRIEQYRIDFMYRFNERYAFLSDVRFDARTGNFTRTSIGLHTRIGNAWEVFYALTFRQDARREGDVEFTVRLRLTDI